MCKEKNNHKKLMEIRTEDGLTPLSQSEMHNIEGGGWITEMAEKFGCYVGKMLSSAEMDFVNSPIHGPDGYKYM